MLYLNYKKKEKQEKEIRSFRHDYTNILVSLNEAIKEEDIDAIRTIYREVIADSDRKFYDGKYDIARLSNIQHPAVKSLLSSKMLEAQKHTKISSEGISDGRKYSLLFLYDKVEVSC